MTLALLAAGVVASVNTLISWGAHRWTSAGAVDRRWAKAQALAAMARLALFLAAMGAVWRLVGRPGPLVAYIFAASVAQTALHAALWHKNKI